MAFQSTPSAWRETSVPMHFYDLRYISIHSLRMEGDVINEVGGCFMGNISIHSLRMEGDLVIPLLSGFVIGISIHSLRMEGDRYAMVSGADSSSFQSTPSAWRETPTVLSCWYRLISFQSTPSAWRET